VDKLARSSVEPGPTMSQASTARGIPYTTGGSGVNGGGGGPSLLGIRHGANRSQTSLLPDDSVSQSGGMRGSRSTTSKV
jgi:hypothetical protein